MLRKNIKKPNHFYLNSITILANSILIPSLQTLSVPPIITYIKQTIFKNMIFKNRCLGKYENIIYFLVGKRHKIRQNVTLRLPTIWCKEFKTKCFSR